MGDKGFPGPFSYCLVIAVSLSPFYCVLLLSLGKSIKFWFSVRWLSFLLFVHNTPPPAETCHTEATGGSCTGFCYFYKPAPSGQVLPLHGLCQDFSGDTGCLSITLWKSKI